MNDHYHCQPSLLQLTTHDATHGHPRVATIPMVYTLPIPSIFILFCGILLRTDLPDIGESILMDRDSFMPADTSVGGTGEARVPGPMKHQSDLTKVSTLPRDKYVGRRAVCSESNAVL